MTDDLRASLRDAAATGEILRVVYHRGSQPGTIREIGPLEVSADEVRARDVASGINKTFKLAHLEQAGADTKLPTYDPTTPSEGIGTLGVALELHIAELRGLGRHVESTDTSISVHRSFKNGKLWKGADVSILFNEFSMDAWDDGNGWREEALKSTRPYYVSSPSFDRARTFARLAPAVALFLEEARKLAPRQNLPTGAPDSV